LRRFSVSEVSGAITVTWTKNKNAEGSLSFDGLRQH